jgi:hypothetical protein
MNISCGYCTRILGILAFTALFIDRIIERPG